MSLQEPGGCSIHSSQSSDQMPEMIEWLVSNKNQALSLIFWISIMTCVTPKSWEEKYICLRETILIDRGLTSVPERKVSSFRGLPMKLSKNLFVQNSSQSSESLLFISLKKDHLTTLPSFVQCTTYSLPNSSLQSKAVLTFDFFRLTSTLAQSNRMLTKHWWL